VAVDYLGSPARYVPAESPATTIDVAGLYLQLGDNVEPLQYDNDLILYGVVAPVDEAFPATGTMVFTTADQVLCTSSVGAVNQAVCDVGNALPVGNYVFKAAYSGDANFPPVVGTFPLPVSATGTTTALSAPASATAGVPFAISVTVTRVEAATLPLSGTVQLSVDGWISGRR
jgi:Bacterial Ig-like domain (group 3)